MTTDHRDESVEPQPIEQAAPTTSQEPTAVDALADRVMHPTSVISWKGIFAGAVVAVLAYLALVALGFAVGALDVGPRRFGAGGTIPSVGGGIWMVITAIIALFIGGYAAARASGVIPSRIGATEGLVVAGLFFVAIALGTGGAVRRALTGRGGPPAMGAGMMMHPRGAMMGRGGGMGRGPGWMMRRRGGGGPFARMGRGPMMAGLHGRVARALDGLKLRSAPTAVINELTPMLVRGDASGAAAYLAQEASISADDAKRRLAPISQHIAHVSAGALGAVHIALRAAALVFFAMILFGSAASLYGGTLGALRNIRRPLSDRDRRLTLESRSAWRLGPPAHRQQQPRPS